MRSSIYKDWSVYKVITITHKTTSIQRLKDYFVDDDGDGFPKQRLAELKDSFGMDELLYLNTCNRVTFLFTGNRQIDTEFLTNLFHFINPALREDLIDVHLNVTTVYEGEDALRHFFSVAASLDSLIVGEREILGQIREAYAACHAHGLCGDSIRLAVEHAIVFAKKIYHQTRIGEKPVSVVSLAFRQLMEHIPHHDTGIVMIGAGQTNQQLANFIRKYGFTNVHVFNRSLDKAKELAARIGGKAYPLSALAGFKEDFQVVASCTGAREYVLTLESFRAMPSVDHKKYTILDLAVPRDVDPAIVAQYDVHYMDVDGLQEQARENMAFRQKEVVMARTMLDSYLSGFEDTFRQRQLERALLQIPTEVKALRQKAVEEVFARQIGEMDPQSRAVLDDVVRYLEKKYIGIPMKIAKKTILGLDNFKE